MQLHGLTQFNKHAYKSNAILTRIFEEFQVELRSKTVLMTEFGTIFNYKDIAKEIFNKIQLENRKATTTLTLQNFENVVLVMSKVNGVPLRALETTTVTRDGPGSERETITTESVQPDMFRAVRYQLGSHIVTMPNPVSRETTGGIAELC